MAANNYIYYTHQGILYLPVLQKSRLWLSYSGLWKWIIKYYLSRLIPKGKMASTEQYNWIERGRSFYKKTIRYQPPY
jgi:hypothetical protein